jgi:hypothetical protein
MPLLQGGLNLVLVAFLLSPVQPLADKVGDNPSYDRRKEFKNSIHMVKYAVLF